MEKLENGSLNTQWSSTVHIILLMGFLLQSFLPLKPSSGFTPQLLIPCPFLPLLFPHFISTWYVLITSFLKDHGMKSSVFSHPSLNFTFSFDFSFCSLSYSFCSLGKQCIYILCVYTMTRTRKLYSLSVPWLALMGWGYSENWQLQVNHLCCGELIPVGNMSTVSVF